MDETKCMDIEELLRPADPPKSFKKPGDVTPDKADDKTSGDIDTAPTNESSVLLSADKVQIVLTKNGGHGPGPGSPAKSIKSLLDVIDKAVISFRDIGYEVPVKARCCCGKKTSQHILKNVSGIFRPGVNAILGPTGSGKTTLLDILAGRKNPVGFSGSVLVDGQRQPHNFKCVSGYVTQDDVVMGMLTVRENIEFSAALRLPSSTSSRERKEKVDEILSDLGLEKCAKTKVGTELTRGVSGGERKRTTIAMELITSPRVLFLDEPTTGLDANTAHSVMYLLQRLSRRGMTIILSIHQPRYSIYKLFDTLMLLSQGECVYHGPGSEGLQFFKEANYVCEEHNNPPDFFLDVLSGSIVPTPVEVTALHDSPNCNGTSTHQILDGLVIDVEDIDVATERQQTLVRFYRESHWHTQLEKDLSAAHGKDCDAASSVATRKAGNISYPTSICTQLAVVSKRTWNNMVRNHHALMTQLLSAVVLGLIVGSLYFRVDMSCKSGRQNRVGAFFFIVMNYVFGNMSAVDLFIKERAIFIHETVSGFYRVSAYFFAKFFCDVVPQRVFPILIFSSITYFMIGFQPSADKFFFYVLNIILTSLAGTSVALVFSATTRQHTIGTILTSLVWVCMMVFSGLLVNVDTIPHWLQWLKYLSIFRYSMNAFSINELQGMEFTQTHHENGTLDYCIDGNHYLTDQGIAFENVVDIWINEIALFVLAIGFLTLTYVQLRRTKTVK